MRYCICRQISVKLLCLGFKVILLLVITQGILVVDPKPLLAAYSTTQTDRYEQSPATPTAEPHPGVPQSAPIDPTLIYNNLLVPNLPPQSIEASRHSVGGPPISPEVTNLANGSALTYSNGPKPQACVTFDDLNKWASHVYADGRIQGNVWKDQYAGWNSFAIDDGGFYLANNVTLGYDQAVGNRVSAKIASTQPYAAGFVSPPIPTKQGDTIRVRIRYLIVNPNIGRAAYDWASLGIKPAIEKDTVRYVNGYTHGKWAELENTVVAEGNQVVVRSQGHSPAPQNSAIYFDDIEIFVNGIALERCEF
jgi:hypothetical protein